MNSNTNRPNTLYSIQDPTLIHKRGQLDYHFQLPISSNSHRIPTPTTSIRGPPLHSTVLLPPLTATPLQPTRSFSPVTRHKLPYTLSSHRSSLPDQRGSFGFTKRWTEPLRSYSPFSMRTSNMESSSRPRWSSSSPGSLISPLARLQHTPTPYRVSPNLSYENYHSNHHHSVDRSSISPNSGHLFPNQISPSSTSSTLTPLSSYKSVLTSSHGPQDILPDTHLFLPETTTSSSHGLKHLLPSGGIHPMGSINVKDLTLNELRPHFNKPMAVVAKELGVCITLMKKICRKNGLVRWPHRRIRSLVNRITSLQVIANTSTGNEHKRCQAQIITLRRELSAVIQNPNEKSRKAQADAKARSPVVRNNHPHKSVENEDQNEDILDQRVEEEIVEIEDEDDVDDVDSEHSNEETQNNEHPPISYTPTRPTLEVNTTSPSLKRKRENEIKENEPMKRQTCDLYTSPHSDTLEVQSISGRRSSTSSSTGGKRGSISSILNDTD